MAASTWRSDPRLWLEAFALVNLACLAPDIYLAHSVNAFRHRAEWLPLWFSLAAPVVLLAAEIGLAFGARRWWLVLGQLVGWGAVTLGVAGLVLHLQSRFFDERTLKSLVYAAPFAAPLAYAGLGLLLIMNRMVDADSPEWPLWVLLLALGGFLGNFIFSLTDHAQNGFFYRTEWIPVVSSALAVGFLAVPFLVRIDRGYLRLCVVVLLAQAAVGVLGLWYHTTANFTRPGADLFEKTVYGAPPLA